MSLKLQKFPPLIFHLNEFFFKNSLFFLIKNMWQIVGIFLVVQIFKYQIFYLMDQPIKNIFCFLNSNF